MFSSLEVRKSGRGPGIFSHVSNVRIEEIVERVLKLWAKGSQNNTKSEGCC